MFGFIRYPRSFTLQWHLTNECENDCTHCYDRERVEPIPLDGALTILDRFTDFCAARKMRGHITLSGGNPILYPGFFDLYRAIAGKKMRISILGNAISPALLDRMVFIRKPSAYQVSLEGLQGHNDAVRGNGHYDRTVAFLGELKKRSINSHVMATLTDDNLDEVIPLGEQFTDHADRFTFNRLTLAGRGMNLKTVERDRFTAFLHRCIEAGRSNPVLVYKDNLFNIIRRDDRLPYFRGCTGSGCGAARSFVALTPDGTVLVF